MMISTNVGPVYYVEMVVQIFFVYIMCGMSRVLVYGPHKYMMEFIIFKKTI